MCGESNDDLLLASTRLAQLFECYMFNMMLAWKPSHLTEQERSPA